MKNDFSMITVREYLNVLDNNESNLNDTDTMISIEKYLSEVLNEQNINELSA